MAAEREPEYIDYRELGESEVIGPFWLHLPRLRRRLAEYGLHLVTDADLRVLEIMSTLKIKMCVGEWMISDARELDLCKAELARRGEKP